LKGWLAVGRGLGLAPGVLWGRCLNLGAFGLLVAFCWVVGRRTWGVFGGTLGTVVVASGAYPALFARDLRSYGLASVALFGAFLALHHRRWAWYALAAAVALWSHLLSGVAIGAMAAVAVAGMIRKRDGREVWRAVLAHLGILLAFLPWLPRVRDQLAYVEASQPTWMTPATVANLGRVFTFWFPFGRIGFPESSSNAPLVPLGIAALAVPALFLGAAGWRGRRRDDGLALAAGKAGAVALAVVGLYVGLLWGAQRLGLAHTFHGPRYPALVAPIALLGLGLVVVWGAARLGWPRWTAVAVLVPWIACSGVGQIKIAREEAHWGIVGAREQLARYLPEAGGSVYILPSELAPFYRGLFPGHSVHRLDALDLETLKEAVTVVDVGFWHSLYRGPDALARHVLEEAPDTARWRFPEPQGDYTLYRVRGAGLSALAALRQTGWRSRKSLELQAVQPPAVAMALPEDQVPGPRWSFLEIGPEERTARWAMAERVTAHFDVPLPAGAYILHLEGYRYPFPQEPGPLRIRLPGGDPWRDFAVPAGPFHLQVPVTVERALPRPRLEVEHGVWQPQAVGLSEDSRTLSFLFYGAWFLSAGS